MDNSLKYRRKLWVLIPLLLLSVKALATDLEFVGSASYETLSSSIRIYFDELRNTGNNDSGELYLKLVAMPINSPAGSGHIMSEISMAEFPGTDKGGVLPAGRMGGYIYGDNYIRPPDGTYYVYLLAFEFPNLNKVLASVPVGGNPVTFRTESNGNQLIIKTYTDADNAVVELRTYNYNFGINDTVSRNLSAGDYYHVYHITVSGHGILTLESSGSSVGLQAFLYRNGSSIASDEGGSVTNFRISDEVSPGSYSLLVAGHNIDDSGYYTLSSRLATYNTYDLNPNDSASQSLVARSDIHVP